jgi:glutamyl-tRNA synthetase
MPMAVKRSGTLFAATLPRWARHKPGTPLCFGDTPGVVADEDREFIAQAAGLLPPEPWDETTWKAWTDVVKEASGRKGKGLFMPLRLALTGQPHGPELACAVAADGARKG